ncbi:hypothetical protein MPSEU_000667800 [Mayamaea pseudoterrestris]|nr:hypothetical protein MPSEU_000667800 [Mayamaea pseudoterrestris]
MKHLSLASLSAICSIHRSNALHMNTFFSRRQEMRTSSTSISAIHHHGDDSVESTARRSSLALFPMLAAAASIGMTSLESATAAVGSLPELAETNAHLQGIQIRVADRSQLDAMIAFLVEGFDCKILRKRIVGTVEETWLGFGPEQLSVPDGWVPGVSSFAEYGGHASIALVYDTSSTSVLYRKGDSAPGDNIAYLQLAVPGYRISRMVAAGGNILDAYGHADVVSPSGLPVRGIVGIASDPIMLVAINCVDVSASRSFYETIGFIEREIPYARPSHGTTAFEPAPPAKSVYMSMTPESMGILLIPTERRKKNVKPNPVVDGLRIVYTPSADGDGALNTIVDPSGVGITFQGVEAFQDEEKRTR